MRVCEQRAIMQRAEPCSRRLGAMTQTTTERYGDKRRIHCHFYEIRWQKIEINTSRMGLYISFVLYLRSKHLIHFLYRMAIRLEAAISETCACPEKTQHRTYCTKPVTATFHVATDAFSP